jgi:hypothetical protein
MSASLSCIRAYWHLSQAPLTDVAVVHLKLQLCIIVESPPPRVKKSKDKKIKTEKVKNEPVVKGEPIIKGKGEAKKKIRRS